MRTHGGGGGGTTAALAMTIGSAIGTSCGGMAGKTGGRGKLFAALCGTGRNGLCFRVPSSTFYEACLLTGHMTTADSAHSCMTNRVTAAPVTFHLAGSRHGICLRRLRATSVLASRRSVTPSFSGGFYSPMLHNFGVMTHGDDGIIVSMATFFKTGRGDVDPVGARGPLDGLFNKNGTLGNSFITSTSNLVDIGSFPRGVRVGDHLSFDLAPLGRPCSIIVRHSLFTLPRSPVPVHLRSGHIKCFCSSGDVCAASRSHLIHHAFVRHRHLRPGPRRHRHCFHNRLIRPVRPVIFCMSATFPRG